MRLFLDVPFEEKDEAKALGAKWHPRIKKWFVNTEPKNYIKFARWISNDYDETIIATHCLIVLETTRICFKCHKPTRVVGLGVSDFMQLYKTYEDNNIIRYSLYDNCSTPKEIHLAWVEKEDNIPPALLRYLKSKYSVYTGFSKFRNDYTFSNHCDYCGVIQGNNFLFDEPDSPLSSCTDGNELITRMSNLTIYTIPLLHALQLNWDVHLCSNDYAYLKYGKYGGCILEDNKNGKYTSYEKLYI